MDLHPDKLLLHQVPLLHLMDLPQDPLLLFKDLHQDPPLNGPAPLSKSSNVHHTSGVMRSTLTHHWLARRSVRLYPPTSHFSVCSSSFSVEIYHAQVSGRLLRPKISRSKQSRDTPALALAPVRLKGTDPTQVLIQQPLQPLPVNPLQTQARLPISKGLFGNPSRALRPGIPPRCPSLSSRGRPLNHSARQGKQTPVCPLIRRGKTSGGGGGALGQHGSQTDPRLIHLNPSPSITPAESACLTPTTLAFLTGTGLRIVCHS
ncbi:unnamed protein product [Gadus morhua 'NCC']